MGSLHQVEIVFNKVLNVMPIKAVYNLVELTRKFIAGISLCVVIGTQTVSLAGIESQGHSLEILNVTMCNLMQFEPCFLKLGNLKHVNLGENQITHIDNLQK